MSFFNSLSTLGTFRATRPIAASRTIDPIKRARKKFVDAAGKQLNNIEANKLTERGSWVSAHGDKFLVSIRCGLVPIALNGDNKWLTVDSLDSVKAVLTGAVKAVHDGELDETFSAISAKRKKVKQ